MLLVIQLASFLFKSSLGFDVDDVPVGHVLFEELPELPVMDLLLNDVVPYSVLECRAAGEVE